MQRLTPVAPAKPVPVMTTGAATGPDVGEKPETVGGFVTVKTAAEAPVPAAAVTRQRPSQDPPGTVAVTCVGESTVKSVGVMQRLTAVAPVKPVPVSVTVDPTGPDAGVKPEIDGGRTTVKIPLETPVPFGV